MATRVAEATSSWKHGFIITTTQNKDVIIHPYTKLQELCKPLVRFDMDEKWHATGNRGFIYLTISWFQFNSISKITLDGYLLISFLLDREIKQFKKHYSSKNWILLKLSPHSQLVAWKRYLVMMTSSNGNIFRVTGHLCGEFTGTGPRWIPHTKASDAELWYFLLSASE